MGTPFVDPHFHLWDLSDGSCFEASSLFKQDGKALYGLNEYEAAVGKGASAAGLERSGGVVIEAMSVQFVDKPATELNETGCVAEAEWIVKHLNESKKAGGPSYNVVPCCCLEADNAGATLDKLLALGELGPAKVVGIRQILNKDPSWPRNAKLPELLDESAWHAGLAALATRNLIFDLQANPHQLAKARATFEKHPSLVVVINHIGTPTGDDLKDEPVYWKELEALSKLPHCYVKVSMLSYPTRGTDNVRGSNTELVDSCKRVIRMFTPARSIVPVTRPARTCLAPEQAVS
eukprot:gene11528-17751_t